MEQIGLQQVTVSIRGFGSREPTGVAFFAALGLTAADGVPLRPSRSAWQAARAELLSLDMADFADQAEPTEAFAAALRLEFERAAEVLTRCRPDGVQAWRADGKDADVFVGGWLANEQVDLTLPAGFLVECGRLGLDVALCTND